MLPKNRASFERNSAESIERRSIHLAEAIPEYGDMFEMIEEQLGDRCDAIEILMVRANLNTVKEVLPEMWILHQMSAEVSTLTVQRRVCTALYRALDIPQLDNEHRQTDKGESKSDDRDIELQQVNSHRAVD
jgi:hypothetical protein